MPRRIALIALLLACTGCELIADFDRGKIDDGEPNAGTTAPPPADASMDAGADDDAGPDGE